jgi:hypothetical protein
VQVHWEQVRHPVPVAHDKDKRQAEQKQLLFWHE